MGTLYMCSPSLELLDGPECKLRAPEKHSEASLGSAPPMKEAACVKNQRQRLAKGIHELWKGTVETLEGGLGSVAGVGWGGRVQKSFCTAHKGSHQGFQAESAVITSALCGDDSAARGGQGGEAQLKLELAGGNPGVQARGRLARP